MFLTRWSLTSFLSSPRSRHPSDGMCRAPLSSPAADGGPSGSGLFTLISTLVVSVGVVPWWAVVPSVLLLGGHLSLLRVAVQIDGIRRQEAEAARARGASRRMVEEPVTVSAQEAAEAQHQAEIIELAAHNREAEVYDQYADMGRAVGD